MDSLKFQVQDGDITQQQSTWQDPWGTGSYSTGGKSYPNKIIPTESIWGRRNGSYIFSWKLEKQKQKNLAPVLKSIDMIKNGK